VVGFFPGWYRVAGHISAVTEKIAAHIEKERRRAGFVVAGRLMTN